ncbi:hypothetical protein BH10PLA1_BH10PLA1_07750 [soil metagenome]
MSDPISYLDALLRARLQITEGRQLRMTKANAIRDGIVPTPRLIWFRAGEAKYSLEGRSLAIRAGTVLLVPALARRDWSAERSATVEFFSFQTDPNLPSPGVLMLQGASVAEVGRGISKIIQISSDTSRAAQLLIEAEAKVALAKFLVEASALTHTSSHSRSGDRAVTEALQWLAQNLAQSDPLAELHTRSGLSENQFRRRFKSLVHQSPRDYLFGLRMRQARFHLSETTLPVKQIARQVGYDDPLYFSRRYHQFWKRWPTQERE